MRLVALLLGRNGEGFDRSRVAAPRGIRRGRSSCVGQTPVIPKMTSTSVSPGGALPRLTWFGAVGAPGSEAGSDFLAVFSEPLLDCTPFARF